MTVTAPATASPTDHAPAFRRDGFVVVPGLVDPDEVARLAADLAGLAAAAPPAPPGGGGAGGDYGWSRGHSTGQPVLTRMARVVERSAACRALLAHPELLALVHALEPDDPVPTWDSVVMKQPREGALVAWHRDCPPEDLRGGTAFNTDVYVDRADRTTCLWVLPGSHTWPQEQAEAWLDEVGRHCKRPEEFEATGALPVELSAGDVLVHNVLVLHGSPVNEGSALRRVVYTDWRPARLLDPDALVRARARLSAAQQERSGSGRSARPALSARGHSDLIQGEVSVAVLFDGEIWVHYGFVDLLAEDAVADLGDARAGQVNGLVGAAQPGMLSMVTGLHTGPVPLRVEALDAEPALAQEWEDVVEVTFVTDEVALQLCPFEGAEPVRVPAAGTYRVRWCASGMDAAGDAQTRDEDDPELDRYLLQLWPAPPAPEAVLRQTSARAAHWHQVARETAPPPTAEERAAAARAEAERMRERDRLLEEEWEREWWAGRPPSDVLRAVGGRAHQLAQLDRDLVDALVDLAPDRQRDVALRSARWAWEAAGRADVPEVAGALAALERGEPLPAPFDDAQRVWGWVFPGPLVGEVTVELGSSVGSDSAARQPLAPEAAAVDAVLGAADPHPARAAVDAVDAAASGQHDVDAFFAEVRGWLRS